MQAKRAQSSVTYKKVPTRRKKKKSRSPNWFIMGLSLSAIAMLSATVGALFAVGLSSRPLQVKPPTPEQKATFNSQKAVSDSHPLQMPQLTRPVNVLVLGTKVPNNQKANSVVNPFKGNSDAILLLRFDPRKNRLAVLSIPRDTKVNLARHGTQKINATNRFGGASYSAEVISDLLGGIEIDRYVRVNIKGVEQLIDALGGVEMYVPKDMHYEDASQDLAIHLEQGQQTLDGETAIEFLRFRQDQYGDIGRVQRQQMFLRALQQQALSSSTLGKLPNIISVVKSNVDTNLSVEEMLALAGFASEREQQNVEMLMLPGEFYDVVNRGEQKEISYWLPHERQIQTMMAQHFGVDNNYAYRNRNQQVSPNIRIAIQNSTDHSAAVRSVTQQLQEEGFHNVYKGSPWPKPLETTRIIAQTGNVEAAEAVAEALGVGEVRVESTGELNSVVSIQLGQDWLEQQSKTSRKLQLPETIAQVN